jgi:hypothetical protein
LAREQEIFSLKKIAIEREDKKKVFKSNNNKKWKISRRAIEKKERKKAPPLKLS